MKQFLVWDRIVFNIWNVLSLKGIHWSLPDSVVSGDCFLGIKRHPVSDPEETVSYSFPRGILIYQFQ